MKYQKLKKFISFLLVLAMCLPMLPQFTSVVSAATEQLIPYDENSYHKAVLTLYYNDGVTPVTDAEVHISYYLRYSDRTYVYQVNTDNSDSGQYAFNRQYYYYYAYTLKITVPGHDPITTTYPAYAYSHTINLDIPAPAEPEEPTPEVPVENWQLFDVYYIANGTIPDTYYGGGLAEDYGPSGNDVPLVRIQVDINKLKTYDGTALTYREGQGNKWEFSPWPEIPARRKATPPALLPRKF